MPQHVPHQLRTALPQASQLQPSSHSPQHPSALPPPPRRIVFLAHRDLDNPAAGGSELLVDRLADGLTRLGHQVTLLCGGPA
ncbi:glycosyltransferase family 1 protein, partial [Streptomyces sp. NPDC058307]